MSTLRNSGGELDTNSKPIAARSHVPCRFGSGSILSFRNAKAIIRIRSQPWLKREIWVFPNVRA
jgi:hypothetical protein